MADNDNGDDQVNLEEDPMAFLPADHVICQCYIISTYWLVCKLHYKNN